MRTPKYSITTLDPATPKAPALVLIHEPGKPVPGADHPSLEPHVTPFLGAVEKGDSKAEWFCTLGTPGDAPSCHLLLESTTFGQWMPNREGYKSAAARAVQRCRKYSLSTVAFVVGGEDAAFCAAEIMEGAVLADAVDSRFKSGKNARKALKLEFILADGDRRDVKATLRETAAILEGVLLTRELVNAPNNVLTPAAFAREARRVAKRHDLKARVLTEKQLQEQGYELIWNVGRGSEHPPRLIELSYTPKKKAVKEHVVLVGKGMTFDSGGYSLKTRQSIYKMNRDMAGAGAVLGAMEAIAALKLPVKVTALIGSAHNAVDGAAYMPGAILKSKAGKTVFIENTDAEGRLVLADVLARAGELKADIIWDFATLTGAAGAALGPAFAALFTDDEDQHEVLMSAAEASGDLLWPLPLWQEYEPALTHHLADISNMSSWGPGGGATHAANFLRFFVPKGAQWAHVDMGMPCADVNLRYYGTGATGYGVRLIVEGLRRLTSKG